MLFIWNELLPMLAGWVLLMIALTGVLEVLLPEDLIGAWLGTGFTAMLVMLVIGIPVYVCATASTPIAAALILKGLSPGAALVFLLAGPATNLATMGVVRSLLGNRALLIYLGAIAATSLGLGWLLDQSYRWFAITPVMRMGSEAHAHLTSSALGAVVGALFLGLMICAFVWTLRAKWAKSRACCPAP